MWKSILGLGAGAFMGVALFAAPASATLVLESDGVTDVGLLDQFMGACAAGPGASSLADEIACINEWQDEHVFVDSDAVKMETLDFLAVDDTGTGGADNMWAVELEKQGGWFSVKTGSITCNAGATDAIAGAECDPADDKYFLVFENLDALLYAVFHLDELSDKYGYHLDNIEKISHITIVPLPAAAFLFGSALLGGGLMRRRKMIRKHGLPAA